MADAIVGMFPRNCEVAIHDMTKVPYSLVYIVGNTTGRKLGAPVADLILEDIRKYGRKVKDRLNYRSKMMDGRELRLTTSYIRNGSGEVIAVFCINFDTTDYVNAIHALEVFSGGAAQYQGKAGTFADSLEDTIGSLYTQSVSEIGKQPSSMSTEEKTRLVEILEKKGAFLIKGAVDQIAVLMGVSKYTIYNYLQKNRAIQAVNKL